jgi:hypothetical protein
MDLVDEQHVTLAEARELAGEGALVVNRRAAGDV